MPDPEKTEPLPAAPLDLSFLDGFQSGLPEADWTHKEAARETWSDSETKRRLTGQADQLKEIK